MGSTSTSTPPPSTSLSGTTLVDDDSSLVDISESIIINSPLVDDSQRVDGSFIEHPMERMNKDVPTVPKDGKRALVTVGATAPFNALIRACLAHGFLQALKEHNFTELRFQWGKDGDRILKEVDLANVKSTYGIDITGFDFKQNLIWEMAALRNTDVTHEGLLISHAGGGTIVEVMQAAVPSIVVPNPDLLHNHQVELAEQMEEMKYLIHGKLKYVSSHSASPLPQLT